MQRRTSSLLSRLAVALLAICGFVAPEAVRERDVVVQSAGGKPSYEEPISAAVVSEPQLESVAPSERDTVFAPRAEPTTRRRYLLHRAWLI